MKIIDEFFGGTSDEATAVIQRAYAELDDLRTVAVPSGLTRWDLADLFLDTLSGHVSSGPVDDVDLAGLIRDALDQLDESDAAI